MTQQQAQDKLAAAETEATRLREVVSVLEQRRWKECKEAEKRAVESVQLNFADHYDHSIIVARRKRDLLQQRATALKISLAADLCGLPLDATMIEWVHDWEGWKPTRRTGKLEVYLHGTEWPKSDHNPPQIGTVIVRIVGKNGRPTKQAAQITRESRDMSFRKYAWLPKGKKPKAILERIYVNRTP